MTRAEFIEKYEDRIAGVATRGFRQALQYQGEADMEGRAIKNIMRAVTELMASMTSDLFPEQALPAVPAKSGTPIPPSRRSA